MQLDVDYAYYYEEWNNNIGYEDEGDEEDESLYDIPRPLDDPEDLLTSLNDTILQEGAILLSNFKKRDRATSRSTYWSPSQVSVPKGKVWQTADSESLEPNTAEPFLFNYDSTAGSGQYVYVIREDGIWVKHDVSSLTGNPYTLPASLFLH